MRGISGLAEELLAFQLVFFNGICIRAQIIKTEEHTNKCTILLHQILQLKHCFDCRF